MKNIRVFNSKWDYLKYPATRTLQISRLFIGRHFPGCSCWSIDISTAAAITCLSKRGTFAIGNGWKDAPYFKSLLSPWQQITLHLGMLLVTFHISKESIKRHIHELERAEVKTA